MLLFRVALVVVFLFMSGRLYQLQIVQGESFQQRADDNRFDLIEVPAPRGVIYDQVGTILTRNRPSFEIAIVPEDLPFDDPETDEDEEALEIAKVLHLIRADSDEEIALRIAELMFSAPGPSRLCQSSGCGRGQTGICDGTWSGSTRLPRGRRRTAGASTAGV